MLARRSLGDSPLEHEPSDIGLLDFIGRSPEKAVTPRPLKAPEIDKSHNDHKADKKIVSYYVDKDVIKRVKALATLTERSYSSLAAEALRNLLRNYGF